ncbi:MAG: hypothetical protein Q9M94_03920 [Candidatus Gracilibacteria bacterium]|nr:hypothetical protein [Candidatus Gracilibacteria bacterium]
MIEVLDRVIDKKQCEYVFVKMDVYTYDRIIYSEKDITIPLHNMEKEILNSKGFDNLDNLFDDLEK